VANVTTRNLFLWGDLQADVNRDSYPDLTLTSAGQVVSEALKKTKTNNNNNWMEEPY